MKKIVFETPPEGFSPTMEVSACYCSVEDKFLFLENSDNKEWASTWSVPAGKIDPNETPLQGAIRETYEETGIRLKPEYIKPFKIVYIRYPNYDFMYHMFKVVMPELPKHIQLRPREHKQAAWMTSEEILKLPLMPGAEECFLNIMGGE